MFGALFEGALFTSPSAMRRLLHLISIGTAALGEAGVAKTITDSESQGELAQAKLSLRGIETIAHDVATPRGGRVVKFIGDEVMFVSDDAAAACDIALALIEEFRDDPQVKPRGGVAYGDLLVRGGDYCGPVVNLAARLAELAVRGEVLATTSVAENSDESPLRFDPAGCRMLRGFDEPVRVLNVVR